MTITKIKGLWVRDLAVHEDDRGELFECLHAYEVAEDTSVKESLKMSYFVRTRAAGTVRAFHAHEKLWDYFCIVEGSAAFCFVDARQGKIKPGAMNYDDRMRSFRPDPGTTEKIVLSGRHPRLITVPPGIYHGWMALEPNTILASFGTQYYNRSCLDEHRVAPCFFDQEFGKSPWSVEGR